mmetsp:Transcript_12947/g.42696  ORF Transcript_12947/g.42696 Transcript_12947/m.42696 type:complete len:219 (+) Transcript_12947:270-926(+)
MLVLHRRPRARRLLPAAAQEEATRLLVVAEVREGDYGQGDEGDDQERGERGDHPALARPAVEGHRRRSAPALSSLLIRLRILHDCVQASAALESHGRRQHIESGDARALRGWLAYGHRVELRVMTVVREMNEEVAVMDSGVGEVWVGRDEPRLHERRRQKAVPHLHPRACDGGAVKLCGGLSVVKVECPCPRLVAVPGVHDWVGRLCENLGLELFALV